MLFCKYPFERKGDDREPHKFQKILERIQRVRCLPSCCARSHLVLLLHTEPQVTAFSRPASCWFIQSFYLSISARCSAP